MNVSERNVSVTTDRPRAARSHGFRQSRRGTNGSFPPDVLSRHRRHRVTRSAGTLDVLCARWLATIRARNVAADTVASRAARLRVFLSFREARFLARPLPEGARRRGRRTTSISRAGVSRARRAHPLRHPLRATFQPGRAFEARLPIRLQWPRTPGSLPHFPPRHGHRDARSRRRHSLHPGDARPRELETTQRREGNETAETES